MPILHPASLSALTNVDAESRLWLTRIAVTPHTAGRVRLALLSDPHTGQDLSETIRGQLTAPNVEATIAAARASDPDAALWLGDIARGEGRAGDYAQFRELLTPLSDQTPVILGLGNHDLRSHFLEAFAGQAPERADGKLHLLADIGTPYARIFLADTCLHPAVVGGAVGQAQLDWIAAQLAAPDPRPIILALHHSLGNADEDLLDADRLFAVLRGDPRVKLIVHGHIHRWTQREAEGIAVWSLPSCGFTFEDEDWLGWAELELSAGGLRLTPMPIHRPAEHLPPVELAW